MAEIQVERADGVMTITIARPAKKNALTAAMYQTMADALAEAQEDKAVRVILLRGGDGNFTSGNDLEDFLKSPPKDDTAPVFQFLARISSASKPIVAAVPGLAIGVGVTMLLHCDLVYAADTATFSLPFTQLGLCPEAASSALLPRLAGHQVAAEKLLLGEAFDALEAHRIGIVNRVLPAAGRRVRGEAGGKARGAAGGIAACDEGAAEGYGRGGDTGADGRGSGPLRHDAARAGSARGDDGVLREAQAGFPSVRLTDRRSRARRRRTAGALPDRDQAVP